VENQRFGQDFAILPSGTEIDRSRTKQTLLEAGGIDFLIAEGKNVPWDQFSASEKYFFQFVQLAMQFLFYTDSCATFFDNILKR
jgi:hypothetical protein